MLKKFSLIIGVFLMLFACSIERDPNLITALGQDITQECIEAGVSEQYPYGGCYIIFWNNGEEINRIFIKNGAPGEDGINGINGIDGIDGVDGVSATANVVYQEPSEGYPWGGYFLTIGVGDDTQTVFIPNGADGINGLNGIDGQDGASVSITTEEVEGGTIITITQGGTVTNIFIKDGIDGTNGLDGIDGIDGVDGVSATVTIEQTEGGYWLDITVGGETTRVFISNGIDGTDGQNGLDGLAGIDGIDGIDGVSATIRTEVVEPSEGHPYGGYNMYITVGDETTVIFISNGADGENGLDGLNSLFVLNTTEVCESGGIEINMGLDINRNGVLDSDEVQYTEVLCNGVDGINGVDGADGAEGTVTICHEMKGQQNAGTYPVEWDNYDYIQLTMTFAEYTYHKLIVHGGQTTQNDQFDVCNPGDGSVLITNGGIPE